MSDRSGWDKTVAPASLDRIDAVLEAVDREIGFYRRRAGQVFWICLLVAALILLGQQTVRIWPSPEEPQASGPTPVARQASQSWIWQHAAVETIFFLAVSLAGIALGAEYRRRIHILKASRLELLEKSGYLSIYPTKRDRVISEIEVLYVALAFLSFAGISIAWLRVFQDSRLLLWFLAVAVGAFAAVTVVIWRRSRRAKQGP